MFQIRHLVQGQALSKFMNRNAMQTRLHVEIEKLTLTSGNFEVKPSGRSFVCGLVSTKSMSTPESAAVILHAELRALPAARKKYALVLSTSHQQFNGLLAHCSRRFYTTWLRLKACSLFEQGKF